MTTKQAGRWAAVLDTLAGLLPAGAGWVLVDGAEGDGDVISGGAGAGPGDAGGGRGGGGLTGVVADGLADRLRASGRACRRLTGAGPGPDAHTGASTGFGPGSGPGPGSDLGLGSGHASGTGLGSGIGAGSGTDPGWVTIANGSAAGLGELPATGWDVVVRLGRRGGRHEGDRPRADVVVDVDDPGWPVIRRVAAHLGGDGRWHVSESQAFFGIRAATWDSKFGDDLPAYAAAVGEMGLRPGAAVLDVGCGTGRALPALREAVGTGGRVLALDVTPEMLAATRRAGRGSVAALVLADAQRLPVADGALDAVFAAGLVHHLPDMAAGLAELARVSRPGGRLAIFHPSGRAALAARHGRTLRPDEPLSAARLGPLLTASGWHLDAYDDPPHRFLVLATRG